MKNRTQSFASPQASLLTSALALFIVFIFLVTYQWVSGRRQLLEELRTEAMIISANSSAALAFEDEKGAHEILSALWVNTKIMAGALYLANGELFTAISDSGSAFPDKLETGGGGTSGLDKRGGYFSLEGGLVEPVLLKNSQVGTLVLRFTYAQLYQRMAVFVIGLLAVGALALFMTHLFTIRLRKRMSNAEKELERMAFYDRVTGLPNRTYFESEIKKAVEYVRREQKCAALMFIDVDNFKKVNDLCGHQAGDQVLMMIAERLKKTIRVTDFIARVGGDEFVVILYGIGSPGNAARIAENMIESISQPFPSKPHESHVGLSVGVTMMSSGGEGPETLVKWADMAMYVAKSQGKNRYQFFSAEINERVHQELRIEAGMRSALKETEGGLWVAYQPQFCAKSRKMVGVEALMRWTQKDGVPVSPAEFIAIAEKTNLIAEVGTWVVEQVCRDLAELESFGIEIPRVAINVSPLELRRGDAVVNDFCRILERYGQPRERFEFEVTENALMSERGSEVLAAFREAGFSLAIDDFGAGYSSLGYLKRFQVSALKIDRQFIQSLPEDQDDRTIVAAVIQMAKALGVVVVAEGVETEAQAAFLSGLGCDVFQGYLLCKPLPARSLSSFMQGQRDGQVTG